MEWYFHSTPHISSLIDNSDLIICQRLFKWHKLTQPCFRQVIFNWCLSIYPGVCVHVLFFTWWNWEKYKHILLLNTIINLKLLFPSPTVIKHLYTQDKIIFTAQQKAGSKKVNRNIIFFWFLQFFASEGNIRNFSFYALLCESGSLYIKNKDRCLHVLPPCQSHDCGFPVPTRSRVPLNWAGDSGGGGVSSPITSGGGNRAAGGKVG